MRSRAVACPWASLVSGKLIHPHLSCFIWWLLHKKTPTQAWAKSIAFNLASQWPLPRASLLFSVGYDGFISNNPLSIASLWCLFKTNSNFNISMIDFSSQFFTISFTNSIDGRKGLIFGIHSEKRTMELPLYYFLYNPAMVYFGRLQCYSSGIWKAQFQAFSLRLRIPAHDLIQRLVRHGIQR